MTATATPRYQLPYLVVSQAQKEITHNEALLRIDALLQPMVEAVAATPPAIQTGTQAGKCWLVGTGAAGEWAGKQGQIACWNGSGWSFVAATEGLRLRNKALACDMIYTASGAGSGWQTPAAINNATGGTVVDIEARLILNQLLFTLRGLGIVPA